MKTWSGNLKDKNHVRRLENTVDSIYVTTDGKVLKNRGDIVYELKPLKVGNYLYLPRSIEYKEKPASTRVDFVIAETFIDQLPNLNHYRKIKHKDGNMLNNNLDNLEWSDYKPARNYKCVKVKCIETGQIFASQHEAAEFFHVSEGYISGLLSGNYGSSTVKKQHLEIVD